MSVLLTMADASIFAEILLDHIIVRVIKVGYRNELDSSKYFYVMDLYRRLIIWHSPRKSRLQMVCLYYMFCTMCCKKYVKKFLPCKNNISSSCLRNLLYIGFFLHFAIFEHFPQK